MRTIAKVYEEYDDERNECLCWSENASHYDGVIQDPAELTITELAEFLDQDAEDCNRHSFCGVHAKLVEMMSANGIPVMLIAPLMNDIGKQGGLHRALLG